MYYQGFRRRALYTIPTCMPALKTPSKTNCPNFQNKKIPKTHTYKHISFGSARGCTIRVLEAGPVHNTDVPARPKNSVKNQLPKVPKKKPQKNTHKRTGTEGLGSWEVLLLWSRGFSLGFWWTHRHRHELHHDWSSSLAHDRTSLQPSRPHWNQPTPSRRISSCAQFKSCFRLTRAGLIGEDDMAGIEACRPQGAGINLFILSFFLALNSVPVQIAGVELWLIPFVRLMQMGEWGLR